MIGSDVTKDCNQGPFWGSAADEIRRHMEERRGRPPSCSGSLLAQGAHMQTLAGWLAGWVIHIYSHDRLGNGEHSNRIKVCG